MTIFAVGFAVLIGLSLGLLGGGGSILTVPVFVYILGYPAKTAIAMSLPVVCVTSLFAAANHYRVGNLELRLAGILGLVTMAGAFLGARLSVLFSGTVQLIMLALVMFAAAISMLRSSRSQIPAAQSSPLWLIGLVGAGVGILTGVIGIGGGFLLVPALVVLVGLPVHKAVGTSLLVIAMTTAAGFAGHIEVATVPWSFVAMFAAIATVGSVTGATLSRRVSARSLKRGFAVLLIVISLLMLYQNVAVLT